jgi:hypothetical protein
VPAICLKAKIPERAPHRPLKLSVDQEAAVCRMIASAAETGNYTTQPQVLNCVESEFRKALTDGWLHSFWRRLPGEVRRAILAPQKLPRLQVPRSYLDHFLVLIKTWVPPVPAELIFKWMRQVCQTERSGSRNPSSSRHDERFAPQLFRGPRNPSPDASLLHLGIR